jgi:hypothetical protein
MLLTASATSEGAEQVLVYVLEGKFIMQVAGVPHRRRSWPYRPPHRRDKT